MNRSLLVFLVAALCISNAIATSQKPGMVGGHFGKAPEYYKDSKPAPQKPHMIGGGSNGIAPWLRDPNYFKKPTVTNFFSTGSYKPVTPTRHVPTPTPRPSIPVHHTQTPTPKPVYHAPTHHVPTPTPKPTIPVHHTPVPTPKPVYHPPTNHHVPTPTPKPTTPVHHTPVPTPKPATPVHHVPTPKPTTPVHHVPTPTPKPTTPVHQTPTPHTVTPAPKSTGQVNYPHLSQGDPRWKGQSLGHGSASIGAKGCLMTSVTSMIAGRGGKINGETPNPATMNSWLQKNGGFSGNNFVWGSLKPLGFNFEGKVSSKDAITKALNSGKNVLLNVNNGHHYVLATGVTPTGYTVMDPGYSRTTYNFNEVTQAGVYSH